MNNKQACPNFSLETYIKQTYILHIYSKSTIYSVIPGSNL